MKKTLLISILALLGMTQAAAQLYEPLFLVRDGVKWVNEKVVINQGDTTYSYYTYEIQGDAPEEFHYSEGQSKACHYYTGEQIDIQNDSIISYLAQNDWNGVTVVWFQNFAQTEVISQNRNMLQGMGTPGISTGTLLYSFYQLPIININTYISHQIDPIFNEDNLIEVDPIEVEGIECHRIAHINEHGDVLFYVVEGIGFDSRDMGDLLTPFTRKPDPDADYQEYWGLSHVIKDGKIIYKGMRYNEDHLSAVGEVAADSQRAGDANYYNLMGQPVGKDVPTTSGIYIHQGKKIIVR